MSTNPLSGRIVYVTGHRTTGRAHMEEAAGYALACGARSVWTALERPQIAAVIESQAVLAVPCAAECPKALADLVIAEALARPRYVYWPEDDWPEYDLNPISELHELEDLLAI
jgi:hypothetical protein